MADCSPAEIQKFRYAAIAATVGAVLSFIGLIHAPAVSWAANPTPQWPLAICSSPWSAWRTRCYPGRRIRWWSTSPISSPATKLRPAIPAFLVAALPVAVVAPNVVADGPAPELENEMWALYEAKFRP